MSCRCMFSSCSWIRRPVSFMVDACWSGLCFVRARVLFRADSIATKQTNIYLSPSERDILPLAVIVKLFDFTNICFPEIMFRTGWQTTPAMNKYVRILLTHTYLSLFYLHPIQKHWLPFKAACGHGGGGRWRRREGWQKDSTEARIVVV